MLNRRKQNTIKKIWCWKLYKIQQKDFLMQIQWFIKVKEVEMKKRQI